MYLTTHLPSSQNIISSSETCHPSSLHTKTMLSRKRLLQMVRRWHELASSGRKRIISSGRELKQCNAASVAQKGYLFMYTIDGKRFMVPLQYLTSNIFIELLRLSEEEYGLPSGAIWLPCDAACMKYILSLLRRNICRDMEMAVLASVANGHCKSALAPEEYYTQQQQVVLYGF